MNLRRRQSWFLIAAALFAGCDIQPRTGIDDPISQIVVSPDTLTLDPQQNFSFRVFGRTRAGDSVPVSVHWTASVGSISSGGVYTADTSATDAVITATLA